MKIKEIVKATKYPDGLSIDFLPIEEYVAFEGEKALSHSYAMDILRRLMGRTLTLIDATMVDKSQNKSVKDIIRGIYSDEMNRLSEDVYDQEIMNEIAEEHYKDMSDEDMLKDSVTIEEALGVK